MLKVHVVPVTAFAQNCTIVVCQETLEATVIDCGDAAPVLSKLQALGVKVTSALATHGHLDHVSGIGDLVRELQVPLFLPQDEELVLGQLQQSAAMYGLAAPTALPEPDRYLSHGDSIQVGNGRLDVLHCPGHSLGHIVFYDKQGAQIIVGDVLFQGSIGRTDLPGGSWEQLQQSIREQLYVLPPETRVYCGHGPTTTLGTEAQSNPFVRA